MITLWQSFENGLKEPFKYISDAEALHNACNFVGAFAVDYATPIEREIAMGAAGRYVGAIHHEEFTRILKDIFKRCSKLEANETIKLSPADKAFIKAGIEGTLYRPFYE